jgi:hypothetical protein
MNIPLLSPLAPYVLIVGVGLAGFAGVQTWRIGNLKYEANVAEGEIKALTAANSILRQKREDERIENQASFNGLSTRCTTDIIASLKTGRLIERITNAPAPRDGTRGRIPASSVREIFGSSEPVGKAGPVPR